MAAEIIGFAAVAAAPISGLVAKLGLKMREQKRLVAELLLYAVALIPMVVVAIMWAALGDQPPMPQRILLGFLGGAIGALVGAAALIAIGEAMRPAAAQTSRDTQTTPANTNNPSITNNAPSINTFNQSGGTNTINLGPTRLAFNTAIADQEIISKLTPGKPVDVEAVGSPVDHAIGAQYAKYLRDKGFDVDFGTSNNTDSTVIGGKP